jgi:hypothetical protein
MGDHRNYWYHKPTGATHAQVIGRKFYLAILDALFEGAPKWNVEEKNFPKERLHRSDFVWPNQLEFFKTKNPVFQIKTHKSMRYFTHSERIPIYNLKYWGNGVAIRQKYMEGVEEVYAKS